MKTAARFFWAAVREDAVVGAEVLAIALDDLAGVGRRHVESEVETLQETEGRRPAMSRRDVRLVKLRVESLE